MRYFLEISYLGRDFHGWQIQQNAHSVQAELESALSTILRKEIQVTASGRTDAGVHAKKQVVHFDAKNISNLDGLSYKLNAFLPPAVAVHNLRKVVDQAHARFDATARSYEYFIHSRKDPFLEGLSYHFKPSLDLELINQACARIIQWEDFQCFSKVKTDVNNFNCRIDEAKWISTSNGYLFSVTANRFLRGMVRAIVGTLIEVGQNKLSLPEFDLILGSRNRSDAGTSVPAHGLYLSDIKYPDSIYIN